MARTPPTLVKRGSSLATGAAQRVRLAGIDLARTFEQAMAGAWLYPLRPTGLDILQINVGRRCNQTCRHCHVDAGPDRKEVMLRGVIEAVLGLLERHRIPRFDITGGAPELHPDFREIVVRAAATGAQRGDGGFEESGTSLQRLNALGYGTDPRLARILVTNPVGTVLPGDQRALETRWKREMQRRFGIVFNNLHTITNMPISRFLEFLDERGKSEEYLTRLANAFNPAAAGGVMCRTTLSVGYDGTLYDCDFNQMLDLPVDAAAPRTIFDATVDALAGRAIVVGPHCFGCTAGAA